MNDEKEFDIKKIDFSKYLPFIIMILSTIIISIPLFSMNLSEYNEFRIHIGRVTAIKEVLKDGVFPPFLSYKHMNGFGYALNIFYGPITTYVPILISYIVGSTTMAIKIFTALTILLSGITMYFYIKKISKNNVAATIGALIYMTAPYKLTDIFSRNALGEYTAFIFIPILFSGLYELINLKSNKDYLIAIGAIGLILSHTITTIYTAIFAILYIVFFIKELKNKKIWKKIFLNTLLILLVTAFYFIPLLECKKMSNYTIYDADQMNTHGYNVYKETASFQDLFSNELLKTDDVIVSLGIVTIILSILSIICFKDVDKKYKDLYIIYLIFSIISIFMSTKLFPWSVMPQFLTIIQFAWRMLGFFIFFDAFICGINVMIILNKAKSMEYIILAFIILSIFILSGVRSFNFYSQYDSSKDINFENNITNSISIGPYYINRDYMPCKAIDNINYLQKREDKTYLLKGNAIIENESKDKLNDSMEISNAEDCILELPYLYYPGFTVTLNGKCLKTFESNNGFVCVEIKENGQLIVKYTGTIIEKAGYLLSAIGFVLLITYIAKQRKNDLYYK